MIDISFPKIAMYSACRGSGEPFVDPVTRALKLDVIAQQAQWRTVIMDVWPSSHRTDFTAAFRQANPNIFLIGYAMGHVYWTNPNPFYGQENDIPWMIWKAVESTDGILWNTKGKPYGWCNINGTKESTMNAIADIYIQKIIAGKQWDGLFLDVLLPGMLGIGSGEDVIDIARLGFATVADLHNAWRNTTRMFLKKLRAAVSSSFPIVCNGGFGFPPDLVNGHMRENFPFQGIMAGENDWYANMLFNAFWQPGVLLDDKFHLSPQMNWICTSPNYNQEATHQKVRFGLGTSCLGDGIYHSLGKNEWEPRRFWWYDCYDINLGQPTRSSREVQNDLWFRTFTKGAVIVNSSFENKSYYTSQLYHENNGPWKRAWNIPARDSLFLLK